MFLGITWCSRIIILPKLRIASRQNTPDSTAHNRERSQNVNESHPTTHDSPAHARECIAHFHDSTAHIHKRIARRYDSTAHARDSNAHHNESFERHRDSTEHVRDATARHRERIAQHLAVTTDTLAFTTARFAAGLTRAFGMLDRFGRYLNVVSGTPNIKASENADGEREFCDGVAGVSDGDAVVAARRR